MSRVLLSELSATASGEGEFNVIIETPSGSRNKFNYDPELDLIRHGKVLPLGAVFPYEFGFIPSTLGEDGDPLDVLLFMDADRAFLHLVQPDGRQGFPAHRTG